MSAHVFDALRTRVVHTTSLSYAPYSDKPFACILLLADGSWIPGVRVENASFPLTIPAPLNAWTTAVALARKDVVAVAGSAAFSPYDVAYLNALFTDQHSWVRPDVLVLVSDERLPRVRDRITPFMSATVESPQLGIQAARTAARRADVRVSNFPVGTALELEDGRLIPGCNVEHDAWAYMLCSERNAIGTAISYGFTHWRRLYLTCLKDDTATPCGACRQILVEHAPDLPLMMDRGPQPAEATTPAVLLPHYFTGAALTIEP